MPEPAPVRPATHEEVRARLLGMIGEITRRDPAEAAGASDATPCVGGGLLNDSLDVLEFVVALQREFGISIRDGDLGRKVLTDLGTVTRYVLENRIK